MSYYFVFQNKTFSEEKNGGYLWAPQGRCAHWKLMQEVTKGDVIFHCYNQSIVAVSVAKSDCYDCVRPSELDNGMWDQEGWMVDTAYYLMDYPIRPKEHMDTVLELQPVKYAPFNRQGRGNTGYLFCVTPELADFFLSKLKIRNTNTIDAILQLIEKE